MLLKEEMIEYLAPADLAEFVSLYRGADENVRRQAPPSARWCPFDQTSILTDNDRRLDLSWRTDETISGQRSGLARHDELSAFIVDDLQRTLSLIIKSPIK